MTQTRKTLRPATRERQAKVASLLVAGFSQHQIADRLGVHDAQISRDVAYLNERFVREAEQDIRIAKGLDLDRINVLLAAIWPKAMDRNGKAQVSAVRVAKELIELRAKIVGTEAPQKIETAIDATMKANGELFDMSRLTPDQAKLLYERIWDVLPAEA